MTTRLEPRVTSPSGKRRQGKGFSLAELSGAGLTLDLAHRMGLPVDKRRSSSHEENITALKGLLTPAEHVKKIRKKPTEPKLKAEKKVSIPTKTAEETEVKEIKTRKRKRAPVTSKPAEESTPTAKSTEPEERKIPKKRRKSGSSEPKE
jgi:hypothetical protein